MLSKNERKLLRKMYERVLENNKINCSNISALQIIEIYLSSLFIEDQKIDYRNFIRYHNLFNEIGDKNLNLKREEKRK